MTKRSSRLLFAIAAALLGMFVHAVPASADPYTTPSTDPNSADYSPAAWNAKWSNGATRPSPDDVKAGLLAMGLLSSPDQAGSLGPDDLTALSEMWQRDNQLFGEFTKTANNIYARAAASSDPLPPVGPENTDAFAGILQPGKSYSELSPGLKSIVHQMAIVLTGQSKPALPDDQWALWMSPAQRTAYDAKASTSFDWSKVRDGAPTIPNCPQVSVQCSIQNTAQAGINAVADAVDFIKDPFGWIGAKMAAGTAAIWGWIAGLANAGTAPDLSVSWWVDAYKKAMAVGIVLALLVLLWQFIQLSAKKISGPELLESIVLWTPAYLAGIVFGPPLGQFFIQGSTALTDGIVQSFSGFSASATDESMKAAFEAAGAGKAIGGIFVGIFVLIFAVVGAIVLFCSLAVQTLALYLSSALFAVGFAWIISVRHRGGSMKIPFLFLGMLFSRPILFFLLGIGLAITNKSMTFSDEGAQNLANLLMAVVVMFIAAFTPLLLMKFAPVNPAGSPSTGGAVVGGAAVGGAAVGGSMLAGLAARRAGRQSAGAAGSATRGGSRGAAGGAAAGGGAAGSSGPVGPSGPAGGPGPSGAQRAAAAGASGPGTARPAGLQRRSAAPGGPPSVHGQRLARDTGQPTVAGSPVRKPAAGGVRPAPSRPRPGSAGTAGAAAGSPAGGGGGRGLPSQRGSSTRRGPSLGSSTARRLGQGGRSAARDGVEGLDGDQRWDSLR